MIVNVIPLRIVEMRNIFKYRLTTILAVTVLASIVCALVSYCRSSTVEWREFDSTNIQSALELKQPVLVYFRGAHFSKSCNPESFFLREEFSEPLLSHSVKCYWGDATLPGSPPEVFRRSLTSTPPDFLLALYLPKSSVPILLDSSTRFWMRISSELNPTRKQDPKSAG